MANHAADLVHPRGFPPSIARPYAPFCPRTCLANTSTIPRDKSPHRAYVAINHTGWNEIGRA